MLIRVFVVLALVASSAHAQRAPDMATLDRGDGITKLGFDLGFSSLDPPPYTAALRFELWGQYVTRMGLGFYGAFPLARSFGGQGRPPSEEAFNATSIENLELGGLYVISGPSLSWVFRGGVGLPTASGGFDEALTRYYAAGPRLTDLALATGDSYLRLSVSPLIYGDRLFLRADLGFDINLDSDSQHFLRLNIGGGVDVGPVALSLELVNSAAFGEGPEEDLFHAISFTVRFMGKQLQPFISVGVPLDRYRRDRIRFFLSGGLQVAF